MRVLVDATLPSIGNYLDKYFDLIFYHNNNDLLANIDSSDILICRSTLQITSKLLKTSQLKYIATASSGTDHIEKEYLKTRNIKLIDAKGANAQSVCDYVLSSLAWLTKHSYLKGNKVGIVGLGAIGSKLSQILKLFGFEIVGYDPIKFKQYSNIHDLYDADVICIHANLHATLPNPSLNLFDINLLEKLNPGVVIINAARGGIVKEADLLKINKKIIYCTDVFASEPNVNQEIVSFATLVTPHIAGHSIEAKQNAVKYIANFILKLVDKDCSSLLSSNKLIKSFKDFIMEQNIEFKGSKICPILNDMDIQDKILNIYNPYFETQALKLAKDKMKTFIELRKSHTFRHDFFNLTS